MDTLVDKVIEQLTTLPCELQWRVLEFTRALAASVPSGIPGQQLLRFAGTISQEDIRLVQQVIDQDCERVDSNV